MKILNWPIRPTARLALNELIELGQQARNQRGYLNNVAI
jgi:hypothetical protein